MNACEMTIELKDTGVRMRMAIGVTTGLPMGDVVFEDKGIFAQSDPIELAAVALAEWSRWDYNQRQRQCERLRKLGYRKVKSHGKVWFEKV